MTIDNTLPARTEWQKIGMHHHHGIALPLGAIRNLQNSGTGEFLDLIPLITWCKEIGFDTIQLLPINDSGSDPSPYSALTSLALHPIYLTLRELPYLDKFPELQKELTALQSCNSSAKVCYHKVLASKIAFLRDYYKKAFPLIASLPSYKEFAKQQWLHWYALYKCHKETEKGKAWWNWSSELIKPSDEELQFHYMVQYLAFTQWELVKEHAEKNAVFLKGDLPILLNRDSSDVWQHKELFNFDYSAGAPPDMYSQAGQNWGFPLYNWDVEENQGFAFWKERLKIAEKLYHIYRLDHIVGFFRIWAIPMNRPATEGFFLPKDSNLWIPQGEKILSMMLDSSTMLPIGEDLGAVPAEVRATMMRLGIPGTKILRWERYWGQGDAFIDPKSFSPLSMSSVSTHDSETLAEWWEKYPQDSSVYAATLGLTDSQTLDPVHREAILRVCHSSNSLFHINLLQEYLGMFEELSWENPEDDRINIPGQVLDANWTYRFKPTLQEITEHAKLQSFMKELRSCT
jgi:4-alpha-glucanotransferase